MLAIWSLTITALFAAAITPLVIKLYRTQGWLDDPQKVYHLKKVHTQPVPRGGGIVIFLSVLLGSVLFLHYDYQLLAIMMGALILTVVGTLDDVYDLHPVIRLATGLIAALVVVGSGIGIAFIANPFGSGVIHLDQPRLNFLLFGTERSLWILSDLFALFFILWNMNIVNWSKGVDGQMPGFVSIALVFVGILSMQYLSDPTSFNTTVLSFIAAGAFLGFLIWNFYPQRILPGYGAGSLAGYFLSVLAILSGAKVATILMVLAIPTADAIFTITRRILAGKSPLWGDRGHLHHKLLDEFHWTKTQVAVFYWAATLMMGILSLYLNSFGKLITILAAISLVFGVLIWAKTRHLSKVKE